MIPQGLAPINVDVFSGFQQRIDGCASCEQLQAEVDAMFASVTGTIAGINAQLEALEPLLALLEPPSVNPEQIVEWITGFVTNLLTPMLKPYTIYPIQLAHIAEQMAQLPALINVKMAQFPSCSVVTPPLPAITPPATP